VRDVVGVCAMWAMWAFVCYVVYVSLQCAFASFFLCGAVIVMRCYELNHVVRDCRTELINVVRESMSCANSCHAIIRCKAVCPPQDSLLDGKKKAFVCRQSREYS
jgi:hypothetical protein